MVASLALGGETHYHVLDLSSYANPMEIKTAYRRLARKHHPDKVSPFFKEAAQAKFVKLQAAHEALIDPVSREEYDKELHEVTKTLNPLLLAFFWSTLWLWEVRLHGPFPSFSSHSRISLCINLPLWR